MKWMAVTPGEELYLAIRDHAIPSLAAMGTPWDELKELLSAASGSDYFPHYLRGAISVVAMRRMLQFWAETAPLVGAPGQRVRVVSDFIRDQVFVGLESTMRIRIARLVVSAHERSFRPVTQAIRRRLLGGNTAAICYLCGAHLDARVNNDRAPNFLTFEHLWPASAGGDNVDENLLPACRYCQEAKADAMSWEWFNIHNLVLSATPSDEAFRSVTRATKVARRYLHVMELCEERRYSLKRGFIVVGPWETLPSADRTGSPVTFFSLRI